MLYLFRDLLFPTEAEEPQEEELSVEVTLPGNFLAWPGDRVELDLGRLGPSGTYRVAEAENVCTPQGGSTVTLTLKEGNGNVAI